MLHLNPTIIKFSLIAKFNKNTELQQKYFFNLYSDLSFEYYNSINPDILTDYCMSADDFKLYTLLAINTFPNKTAIAYLNKNTNCVTVKIIIANIQFIKKYSFNEFKRFLYIHLPKQNSNNTELPF
jgi:hypothetical protein